MDNLGAVFGPILALGLVAAVGIRWAIALSVVPGLLAAVAIIYAIRHTTKPKTVERQPIRIKIRPVLHGRLGRLMAGVSIFEIGNCAATLLILRATDLLSPGRDIDTATQLAIGLYVAYNLAATLVSVPAGHHGDRRGAITTLLFGVAAFALAYSSVRHRPINDHRALAGLRARRHRIGIVETAEHAAVATLAPETLRGSAFGLLAAVQSAGNLASSAIAGALYTFASPRLGLRLPRHRHGHRPDCPGRDPPDRTGLKTHERVGATSYYESPSDQERPDTRKAPDQGNCCDFDNGRGPYGTAFKPSRSPGNPCRTRDRGLHRDP